MLTNNIVKSTSPLNKLELPPVAIVKDLTKLKSVMPLIHVVFATMMNIMATDIGLVHGVMLSTLSQDTPGMMHKEF